MHKMIEAFEPRAVIVDPISNFTASGSEADAESMLLRLVDFLKSRQITAFLTNLTAGGNAWERTDIGISSIIDTWLLVRDIELGGERNRAMYVLKSRGMRHSNQIREFLLTDQGIQLEDVYVGPEGVLTGSMRKAQEARERDAMLEREQSLVQKQRELDRRRAALEGQIAALQGELEAVGSEASSVRRQDEVRSQTIAQDRAAAARRRGGEAPSQGKATRKGKSE
jgi:circadian clock protein KaiC